MEGDFMAEENRNDQGGDSFDKRQIVKAISTFDGFPIINPRSMRIISLLREPVINISKLAMIMERNPTFREHFIRLSGVPDMGPDSVKEAIRAHGLLNAKHLIFSFLVLPLYTIHDQEEWEHVYTTSILLTNMMKHYRIPESSSLPLAALLHDIGVPLLRRFTPARYDQVKKYARETGQILEDVEEVNIHITHAIASGICVRKWGLQDDIFIPVSYHHSHEELNESEEIQRETFLLQYADWIDHSARGLPCHRVDSSRLARFGITCEDQLWLTYQRDLLKLITFDHPELDDGSYQSIKNVFNEHVSSLVAPVGYVERRRREFERQRKEAEGEEKKNGKLDFNIGKIIKERLQRRRDDKKDDNKVPFDELNLKPADRTHPLDTATQVFSRPKAQKPDIDLDAGRPLRLRGDGKVLETATRVFKRPTFEKGGLDIDSLE